MNRKKLGRRRARWAPPVIAALATLIGAGLLIIGAIIHPQPLYAHHHQHGRLTLYSDRPFAAQDAERVLADVELRLRLSPLDDHRPHSIFIANAPWRVRMAFLNNAGAAALNREPLTSNVFLRRSDIATNILYRASGEVAKPPRTLAYYAAHEITHSFTARRLGAPSWNQALPQWVREGYADYIGLGSSVDIDALWRRRQKGDPQMQFASSTSYDQFALLTAYFLEREGWSVDQLLASRLSLEEAEARMAQTMTLTR